MAAAINVFSEEEEQENSALLQQSSQSGAIPLTEPPPGVAPVEETGAGHTASLLPEDLLSGLGDAFEEPVGRQSVQPLGQAEAPVASVADFDEVETMSERDKQKRLARKTAALPKVGGLSRPWMVAFPTVCPVAVLFVDLVPLRLMATPCWLANVRPHTLSIMMRPLRSNLWVI